MFSASIEFYVWFNKASRWTVGIHSTWQFMEWFKLSQSIFKNTATQKQMFRCFSLSANLGKSITLKLSKAQKHKHRFTEKFQIGTFSKQTHATLPKVRLFSFPKFSLCGVFQKTLTVSDKTTLFQHLTFQSLHLCVFECFIVIDLTRFVERWKHRNTETSLSVFLYLKR